MFARAGSWVESDRIQQAIILLIIVNAAILGLQTSPTVMAAAGDLLQWLDTVILGVFVVELVLRISAHGGRFFRDPWNVFDFAVVAVALVPSSAGLSVLRALRVLRVLRLVTAVPRLRLVVAALLGSLPGLAIIMGLQGLLFYVAAVVATNLFGQAFDPWFGTIGRSLYTLFQVMTLESWSMGIVRPVMDMYPYAWVFFIPFILMATFTMLNLFVAVIVNALQMAQDMNTEHAIEEVKEVAEADTRLILDELRALRAEVAALRLAGNEQV